MVSTPVAVQGLSDALGVQFSSVVQRYTVAAPFTTITNRAQVTDLSKDLLPRMGINRTMFEVIEEVQGETTSSGDRVWKPVNDIHDQVRLVGLWTTVQNADGQYVRANNNGEYLEISFYGTGLNLLAYVDSNAFVVTPTIDGVVQSNISYIGVGTPLINRNYSQNVPINIAANLSLGFHTIKIAKASGSYILYYGFEVLNVSGTSPNVLQFIPGVSYSSGKKLSKSALSVDSYNSNFESGSLGTRGGHVVVYQKSDGTIGKAVQPTDASQLNLTSASHANESIIRSYSFREFGAGRFPTNFDDFSLIGTASNTQASFTLDDGTTTLACDHAQVQIAGGVESVLINANSSALYLTFVGTGLDIVRVDSSTGTDIYPVTIDGVSIGNLNSTGSTSLRTEKIVSGLPYGTHVVKFVRSTAASYTVGFHRFIVYGPSKPSVPSGAVEIAEYYVMANYSATGTPAAGAEITSIGNGLLRKAPAREMNFFNNTNSTWTYTLLSGQPDTTRVNGQDINVTTGGSPSTANAGWVEYTFYGTGFEVRGTGNTALTASVTVSLQNLSAGGSLQTLNSANFPGLTATNIGGWTFTYSSGNLSQATANVEGSGFSISGLTLGVYKIRMQNLGSSLNMKFHSFDVITPIHVPKSNTPGDLQATLSVGSQGIGDSRSFGSLQATQPSNWVQAFGVSASPTSTSTVDTPIPDMTVVIKTTGRPIEITFSMTTIQSSSTADTTSRLYMDGVAIGPNRYVAENNVFYSIHSYSVIVPASAGVHVIQAMWHSEGSVNTMTAFSNCRMLRAREI